MRSEKRDKFKNLAEKRVNKALNDLRLVSNLANRMNYEYTEDDAKKIVRALKAGVEEVRLKFENSASENRNSFTLD